MEKSAFIQVKTAPVKGNVKGDWQSWSDDIKSWGWVESAWTCSGEWDWLLKVKGDKIDNWDDLKDHVWLLREKPWVEATNTWWSEQV